MKKLLTVLLLLCLCACSTEKIETKREYIKPLNEINFLDSLNDQTRTKLASLYGRAEVNNNLLKMIGSKLTDIKVEDYYGNEVDFLNYYNGELVFEIVQYSCEHCLKQVAFTENILESTDVPFIQFFAWGTKDQINDFYERSKHELNEKVIVIPQNEELSKYITDLGVDETPTFLFFKDGKLRFADSGEISPAKFINVKELAFESDFSSKDLVNNERVAVFDLYRGYDDVLNDLSIDSKDKLAKIDNSEELTVDVIGKTIDYKVVYEQDGDPLYKLDNYNKFINKPTVVFYLGYINKNLEKDVAIINEFASNHKDLKMLTILMDTKDLETSPLYKDSGLELLTDVVSAKAEVPTQLIDTLVVSYPAALFIQDNVFVGGCHSIESSDTIERAYETFIGDGSIALTSNN